MPANLPGRVQDTTPPYAAKNAAGEDKTSQSSPHRPLRHRQVSSSKLNTARRPFRRGFASGTTRQRPHGPATALQRDRSPPGDSYSGHTPRHRGFKHHADRAWHRVTTPAPCVLPALVIASTRRVPSLSGVTPRTPPQYGPPSGGHSFRAESARFPGAERRSSPVPSCGRCSLFGIDSRRIHRQALAGLSWLSYSPPPDLPKVVGGVSPESACRQVGRSPRRPRLNGLRKTGPPGRDYATLSSPHPLRSMTALTSQGVSASPAVVAGLTIGSNRQITRVVASGVTSAGSPDIGLLVEASIDLGERLSTHPALRAATCGE